MENREWAGRTGDELYFCKLRKKARLLKGIYISATVPAASKLPPIMHPSKITEDGNPKSGKVTATGHPSIRESLAEAKQVVQQLRPTNAISPRNFSARCCACLGVGLWVYQKTERNCRYAGRVEHPGAAQQARRHFLVPSLPTNRCLPLDFFFRRIHQRLGCRPLL